MRINSFNIHSCFALVKIKNLFSLVKINRLFSQMDYYYLDWKSSFAPILAMFRFRIFFENWNFDPLKNNQKLLIKNFLLCFLRRWIYISSRFFLQKKFSLPQNFFWLFSSIQKYVREEKKFERGKTDVIQIKKSIKKFYENVLIILEEVKFSIFKENSKPKYG